MGLQGQLVGQRVRLRRTINRLTGCYLARVGLLVGGSLEYMSIVCVYCIVMHILYILHVYC